MILLTLCSVNNIAFAITDSPKFRAEFIQLKDTQASSIDFFISKSDLNQDLSRNDALVKVVFDGSSLLREKAYPQNIKLEVSSMINGKKSLLSLINKTIKSKKSAENIYLAISLPRIEQTTELIFDLYDSHNILNSTFKEELVIKSNASTESSLESMPDFDCKDTDGECLVEYLLRHVTFSANYDTNLKTEIYKNDKGRFFVNIPIKKGQKLGSKVRGLNINGSGPGKGSTSAGNFSGIYPYYVEKNEVASSLWNELRNAIEFKFNGSNKSFHFKQDGSLQLSTIRSDGYINIAPGTSTKAPIVFSQGELLTNPIEGAVEYDGTNLYFTNGSTRSIIGERGLTGPAGVQGPAGTQGPAGPPGSGSGIDLSNGGFLNGNISFIGSSFIQDAVFNGSFQYKTGAQNGYVLTSDTNGNASWQDITSLVNGSSKTSSGLVGSIQFSDGSNGFSSDSSNLFWDNTNKRMGIATSIPQTPLDVRGTTDQYSFQVPTSGSARYVRAQPNLASFSGYNLGLISLTGTFNNFSTVLEGAQIGALNSSAWTPTSSPADMVFRTTPNASTTVTERMRITSSGLVGINNIAPNAQLAININNATEQGLILKATFGQTANLTEWHDNGGNTLAKIDNQGRIVIGTGLTNGMFNVYQPSSVETAFYINHASGTRTLRLSNNGFENTSTFTVGKLWEGIAGLEATSGTPGRIVSMFRGHPGQTANLTEWRNSTNNTLVTIDNGGNLGLGFSNPSQKLEINGSFLLKDGTQDAGYVLTSDANGLASWQAAGAGSSEWTDTGPLVHPAEITDNVAIGGTNSSAPIFFSATNGTLQTSGNITTDGIFRASSTMSYAEYSNARIWSGNSSYHIVNNVNDTLWMKQWNPNYGDYIPGFDAEDKFVFALDWNNNSANGGEFVFTKNTSAITFNGDSSATLLAIKESGNIGIGTYTPQTKLHLFNGNLLVESKNSLTEAGLLARNNTGKTLQFWVAPSNAWHAERGMIYSPSLDIFADGNIGNGDIRFYTNTAGNWTNIPDFIFAASGNFGIGNENPSAKLDINGSIAIRDGTQAAGYVLTSDANGLASWQLASSGSTEWTDTGSLVHPAESTDDVAIGGTTSAAPIFFDASAGSMILRAQAATDIPVTVRSATSQTANLQEWQDNAGTILGSIASSGHFSLFPTASPAEQVTITKDGTFSYIRASVYYANTGGGAFGWITHNRNLGSSGLQLLSTDTLRFTNNTTFGTADTGLARNAAGVIEINNATLGTFRDLQVRNAFASTSFNFGVATNSVGMYSDGADTMYYGKSSSKIGVLTGTTQNIIMPSSGFLIFSSSAGSVSTPTMFTNRDSAISRNTAGILEINNGTGSQFRDLKLRNLFANGSLTIIDGTQAAGRVLTSDVNGLASWQNIFTVINGGTFSNRVILNTNALSGANLKFGVIENGVDTFGWQDINNGRLVLKAKAPHAQTLTITPRGNGGGVPTLESSTGQIFLMPTAGGNQYHGFEFSNIGLNIRNQMTPQRILLANYWSSASGGVNHEYSYIGWSNNTFHIDIVNGGTGVTRNIMLSAPVTTINGSIAVRDGNQAAGRVLTSDANGLASWQAISGGAGVFTNTLGQSNSEGFGNGATLNGIRSTVFGNRANADSYDAIAIGYNSDADGFESIAIGSRARTKSAGWGSVALGFNAMLNGDYGIAIGQNAYGTGQAVSIGRNSVNNNVGGITIGANTTLGSNSYVAIGNSASGTGAYAVAIRGNVSHARGLAILGNTTDISQVVIGGSNPLFYYEDVYIGGGVTAATPRTITYHATGGSGTNITGADFEIAGGISTGNASGGSIIFQTSNGNISGTTANILDERMRITDIGNVGVGIPAPQRKLHISEAMRLEPQTSPPASASMGDLYVDDSGALCFYDGVSWSVAAGAGSCS